MAGGASGDAARVRITLAPRAAPPDRERRSVFGDPRVLQRELGAPVWGKAAPGYEASGERPGRASRASC